MATRNLKRKLRGTIARRHYATWNERLYLDHGTGGTNAFVQVKSARSGACRQMHHLTLISEDISPSKDTLVVAVKDNLCTKDFGTTCASAMLQRP